MDLLLVYFIVIVWYCILSFNLLKLVLFKVGNHKYGERDFYLEEFVSMLRLITNLILLLEQI